jgi:hypothetical protein
MCMKDLSDDNPSEQVEERVVQDGQALEFRLEVRSVSTDAYKIYRELHRFRSTTENRKSQQEDGGLRRSWWSVQQRGGNGKCRVNKDGSQELCHQAGDDGG